MAAPDREFEQLIVDAERRAERLIAGLRVFIGIALLAVFKVAVVEVAPQGDAFIEAQISLGRLTLASYALLGLVSLVFTAPRWHRRRHAYAFVTADVAFVLVSIAVSLGEQRLDGLYISALPVAWLAPLILSFNALRLSWPVQAYAGALCVGGLWLLASQIGSGRDGTMPQVLYMSFGGPPNVMRLAMLALAAGVLVFAVMRTRRILRAGLEQARRRAVLSHYLPAQVAAMVEERDRAELTAGFDVVVIVMFVDIRDFTARAEHMAPGDVSAFLVEFRRLLRECVEASGGMIDKFIGDGAMIVFGVRGGEPQAARASVRCATELLERVRHWSAGRVRAGERPIEIGIGIHIGRAFVGAVGDDVRLEFTVVGDVVNTAARLEEATKLAGSPVVASEALLVAAGQLGAGWRPLPDRTVRGRLGLVPAYALGEG